MTNNNNPSKETLEEQNTPTKAILERSLDIDKIKSKELQEIVLILNDYSIGLYEPIERLMQASKLIETQKLECSSEELAEISAWLKAILRNLAVIQNSIGSTRTEINNSRASLLRKASGLSTDELMKLTKPELVKRLRNKEIL